MGFFKPRVPDDDPDEFLRKPLMERGRILTQSWVDAKTLITHGARNS